MPTGRCLLDYEIYGALWLLQGNRASNMIFLVGLYGDWSSNGGILRSDNYLGFDEIVFMVYLRIFA